MVRYIVKLLIVWIFSTLTGCTSGLTPKETIKIKLKASKLLNPYLGVKENPLFIQVAQLKAIDSFQTLDFMSLYKEPAKSLGEGLVYLDPPFPMKPGESVTKIIRPENDTHFIGLIYFFNNFEKATTRHWFPVLRGKKQCLDVILNNTRGVIASCKYYK